MSKNSNGMNQELSASPPKQSRAKGSLVAVLFVTAALILFGLAWAFFLAPAHPEGFGWYLFSFAMGLTMIVLPCTLPLAFVIVPLSMGKGITKGLGIALSFGVGIAITLSLYGVFAALVGGAAISTLGLSLETVKNWVYLIAGVFTLLFALGELGLFQFRMPSYTGAAPAFIQKHGDYFKALLLGLFLGNIGVGCPHPATPLILIEIATSGDVLYGWTLFLVHAIGRILPLLFLALLAILGVNGLSWLVARRERIQKATGWAMVFVAGFILTLGLFTHDWWVNSGIHTALESLTGEERFLGILSQRIGVEAPHRHGLEEGFGLFGLPLYLGNWLLVLLWLVPLWWWWSRERKRIDALSPEKQVSVKEEEERIFGSRTGFFVVVSVALVLIFVYFLPRDFRNQAIPSSRVGEVNEEDGGQHMIGEEMEKMDKMMKGVHKEGAPMMMSEEHDAPGGNHKALLHDEGEVMEGPSVRLVVLPKSPKVGEPLTFKFLVSDARDGAPIDNLLIEHEKLMHVIGVRDDLTGFLHIHPKRVAPGRFVTEGVFYQGGTYVLWSEIKYREENHAFRHPAFTVDFTDAVSEGERLSAPELLTNVIIGEYQVEISYPEPIIAGRTTDVIFTIHDLSGRAVPLANYLGEKMHLAVMKDDLSEFIHTHPEGGHNHESTRRTDLHHEDWSFASQLVLVSPVFAHGGVEEDGAVSLDRAGGINFHLKFETSGYHKLFAEFRPESAGLPEGKALLAEFYVRVFSPDSPEVKIGKAILSDSRDGRPDVSLGFGAKLIISIVLIVLLGFLVRKFLIV